MATQTLAGSRLKTSLRDVASAVSVLTGELFEDTGATNAATILSYATNVDVGGDQGNYSGGTSLAQGARVNAAAGRSDPQDDQRVRGLARATLTTNYYVTDIDFDSYNTDRVTMNRGPNSLLFGIGSPGGIINNDTKQAILERDAHELSVRLGERSSHRETIDFNRTIIKGRLALRLVALNEDTRFQQEPAFTKQQREFLALKAVLFENEQSSFLDRTVLRANFEHGDVETNPVSVLPPGDNLTHWFNLPRSLQDTVAALSGRPLPPNLVSYVPKYVVDNSIAFNFSNPNHLRTPVTNFSTDFFPLYYAEPNRGPSLGLPGAGLAGQMNLLQFFPGGARRTLSTSSYFTLPEANPNGFYVESIKDRNVWDNENNLFFGDTNRVWRNFRNFNAALEQTFWKGRAGFELGFNRESWDRTSRLPFSFEAAPATGPNGNAADVGIDVSQWAFVSGGTGPFGFTSNPNLGRPMLRDRSLVTYFRQRERESGRATFFYNLDFTKQDNWAKWLGRHVLTGLASRDELIQRDQQRSMNWEEVPVGSPGYFSLATALPASDATNITNNRRRALLVAYVGPSLLGNEFQSIADVRLQPISIQLPRAGDTHNFSYWDRSSLSLKTGALRLKDVLETADIQETVVESQVISAQSFFFDGNLVGLVGYRSDKVTSRDRVPLVNNPDERLPDGELNLNAIRLGPPAPAQEGTSLTWSVVAHSPFRLKAGTKLSAHYGRSDNFQPVDLRRDIFGAFIPPPQGATTEYGFTVSGLNDRITFRVNWYKTLGENDSTELNLNQMLNIIEGQWLNAGLDPSDVRLTLGQNVQRSITDFRMPQAEAEFILSTYRDYAHLRQVVADRIYPAGLQAARNLRLNPNAANDNEEVLTDEIPGLTTTRSFKSEGVEIELVANLTENWRLFLNAAQQKTIQTNTAPIYSEVVTQINENIKALGIANLASRPDLINNETFSQTYLFGVLNPMIAETAKDGSLASEQREWRINAITSYDFREGFLKGFGVGGGARWQSSAAIGYPIEPVGTPGSGVIRPILDRPFKDEGLFNADLWLSYRRPLFDKKVVWKIQLNVRNILGERDYIPVLANPDGMVAVVRNPNPLEVFVTNTFRF